MNFKDLTFFPLSDNSKIPPKGVNWRSPEYQFKWDTPSYNKIDCVNYGVITGSYGNSGLLVIDIDRVEDNADFISTLPETFTVSTPSGGYHYYYQVDLPVKTRAGFIPGVDSRGEGGYVVGPGSSVGGSTYIGQNNSIEFTKAPEWLINLVNNDRKDINPSLRSESGEEEIGEGGRNAYLTRVGGALRRFNLSQEALLAALTAENETRCNPPLGEKEVEGIAASVARYTPSEPLTGEPLTEDITSVPAYSLVEECRSFLNKTLVCSGEPTGYESLDKLLGGGLREGELTVLNAEAKTGKNVFMHRIIYNLISRGIKVGYGSRELNPATEVLPSLLSFGSGKSAYKNPGAINYDMVSKWGLTFASGYGYMGIESVKTWFEECVKGGTRFFFLDHMHYMLADPEDYKEVSTFIKSVKTLTKQLNIHVFLIVQPPKLMEGMVLGKNTLRGGAAVGQAADNILTMKRQVDRDNKKTNISMVSLTDARFILAKEGSFYLEYDPEVVDLYEVVEVGKTQGLTTEGTPGPTVLRGPLA